MRASDFVLASGPSLCYSMQRSGSLRVALRGSCLRVSSLSGLVGSAFFLPGPERIAAPRPERRALQAQARAGEPGRFTRAFVRSRPTDQADGKARAAAEARPMPNPARSGAIEPVVGELGLDLIRLDFAPTRGHAHLRLVIDRSEGRVSLEDCTRASGAVGRLLDGLDLIPCRYRLEVSSPGVDRPLLTPRDYRRFEGSRVLCLLHRRGRRRSQEAGWSWTGTSGLRSEADALTRGHRRGRSPHPEVPDRAGAAGPGTPGPRPPTAARPALNRIHSPLRAACTE
jgi:ribosome maturation factor RimP